MVAIAVVEVGGDIVIELLLLAAVAAHAFAGGPVCRLDPPVVAADLASGRSLWLAFLLQ